MPRRLSLLSLLALFLSLGWMRAVHAQNPAPTPDKNPVKMNVDSPVAVTRIPLSVSTQLGRWFPLAVTLSNTGDAVTGTLTLKLYSDVNGNPSDRPVSTFVTTVDLPANQSNKRVWLYGRVEREDCSAGVVEFSGSGIQTRRTRFDLSDTAMGTRTVLTISDADERLTYLSSFRDAMLGLRDVETPSSPTNRFNPNTTLVRTLGTPHELVPTRWIGFDLVDCVVLHDFAHTALSPAQLDALKGYVASGGTLVVFGGVNWQRIASSPLRDLWPVIPTRAQVAKPEEVADLVQRYVTRSPLRGEDKLGGASVIMARGPLAPHARSLDGSSANPVLAVKDYGAGRVVYLAYDPTNPPFSGWGGLLELWKDVFGLSPHLARVQGVTDSPNFEGPTSGYASAYPGYSNEATVNPTSQLETDLARTPQLKTPPVSTIAWFLALYVFCLVPLNYCILRAIDKREWAWITVPIVVAGFSALAYATALKIKGRDLLSRRIEIVRTSNGATLARADTVLWLFSPRKTAYNLGASDARYVIAPRIKPSDAPGSDVELAEPDESKAISVNGAAVNMWDNRTFVGTTMLDLGKGIVVSTADAKGVKVSNGSGFDLHGAVVVSGGKVFPVGEITAGKDKATTQSDGIDLNDPQLLGRITNASHLSTLFPATASEDPSAIAHSALNVALGSKFGSHPIEGSMLIAWGTRDQPATTLKIANEDPRERSVTLFMVRAGDVLSKSPGKVASLSSPATETISTGAGKADRSRLTWDAYLPTTGRVGSLKLMSRGTRGGSNEGYAYRGGGVSNLPAVQWEMWNWQSHTWVAVGGKITGAQPKSGYQYNAYPWSFEGTLSDAGDFVRQPDGRLRVRALTGDATVRNFSTSIKAN